jgi:excisionase family DNA binding protein
MKAIHNSQANAEPTLLLTVSQAAKLVGIGRTTAYSLVKSGEWRTIKIGRLTRLTRQILEAWINSKLEEM